MIFMETYKVVDHAVKGRMEELLNTWRNAGPQHSPLFGPMAQQSIERSIWGASGPPQARVLSPRVQQLQQPHNYARTNSPLNGSSTPTEAGSMATILLARFDRLIDMCVYDQRHAPHMFDSTRMDALVKLRAIVASASLAPDELGQIVQQLDVLESEMQNRTTPQVRSPPQIRSPMHASSSSTNGYRATPPYQQQPNAVSFPPSLAGALASLGKLNSVGGSTPPSHRSTPPPLISGQKPNAALDLVASLRQAGLLPGAATVDQDAEYCQMIKGMEIKLTTHDLQREIPLGSLDAITNKELPLQCRQCANRYPAGAKGQASLDRHLDWHFRQNRRAKDSAARGQSRSWYSKLNDWVRGGHDDTIPPKRLSEGAEQNGGGASLTPAQEAELKAASKKFVVAPSDDPDAAATPCPICKELFKSEWSEDEEEWIWKNCIRVEGRYFHSSCHYSAMVLSQSVGRSTKDSSSDSSREITPQPHGVGKENIGSPPKAESKLRTEIKSEDMIEDVKLAGTKRKSDSDDKDGVQDDEDHSVPTKRTALA
jgi:pre-mRNA cleavage complex 2 protein Pcf11